MMYQPADVLTDSFFNPASIAFIGASPDRSTIRGKLVHFAILNNFRGRIYPVNPAHEAIEGYKCYPSVSAVGERIDLAIIAIPARSVLAAVEDCVIAGVSNVMIIASGFAEEGGSASLLQEQLLNISRRSGIRIAGPNCEGFYNSIANTAATFSPTVEHIVSEAVISVAPHRRVGIVSQSGGQGFALFAKGRDRGLSFSYVVSSGNEVDLTAADFLEYMVHDPKTDVIMLFCEAIRDGERFKRVARAAELAGKPIVIVKIGRSDAGSRAAASHTASLTGVHASYQAIFRRYGIIEADDPDEAVGIATVLATCPLPRGRRVGVVTASGGGGAIVADVCVQSGLLVPELSELTQANIRPLIPRHASALNPVDITAQGDQTGPVTMRCMEVLDESNDVDMIVVVISTARRNHVSVIADRVRRVLENARSPVIFWTYTLPSTIAREHIARAGSVLFTEVKHCGIVLNKISEYAEHQRKVAPTEEQLTSPRFDTAMLPKVLTEHRVKTLLAQCGFAQRDEHLVQTSAAAVDAAIIIGFPVALKVQSPDVMHKTEVGGVKIDLKSKEEVHQAFESILTSVRRLKPTAKIEGMLVQKMAPKGYELVVGVTDDETFGPIVMVGFGGVTVELFGDVSHLPAPVSAADAVAMIERLKSAPLLKGFRGASPVDIAPLSNFIERISDIAAANRDCIKEMEFNPIILHADGSGLTIADALVTLK
jgi:acetate---CoA ligase (ADP-forming)